MMNETKICSKCFKEKDISNFVKHPSTKDKRQNQCRDCRRLNTIAYRKKNKNECTKKYEKTKKGFLVRTYRNMLSRVRGILKNKIYLYKGLPILDKEIFYEWALNDENFNKVFDYWEANGYIKQLSPSIDRKDSSQGYLLENMQWLTQIENSIKANKRRWNKRGKVL